MRTAEIRILVIEALYVEILANALAINVVDRVLRESLVYVVKVCVKKVFQSGANKIRLKIIESNRF